MSASQPPLPNQQYAAGPISFTPADQSFHYTPVAQPAGPPSRPPSGQKVEQAILKLNAILHPSRGPNTKGYKTIEMNMVLRARLELMISFLRLYASDGYTEWAKSADIIAKSAGKGSWLSRRICEWSVNFIRDEENLPTAEYGKMNGTVLEDEDLAQELHLHLQGIGKYVAAQDIVNYMATDEMKARVNLKNGISLRTAQRWMKRMEYRWTKEPKGMYSDGHEREDVVDYRQNKFLPWWAELSKYTRKFTEDRDEIGSPEAAAAKAVPKEKKKSKRRAMEEIDEVWDEEEMERTFIAAPDGRTVVIWRHDECIFYANDRRKIRWVHAGEKAKPYAKGEGASMMVAAFMSEYGWLARWTFRPGGKRDGYYTTEKILEHATEAMDILDETRPAERHVFAYDNATTHTAQPPDGLSARRMVVKPPTERSKKTNFLCTVNTVNGVQHVRMRDGKFADGTPQSLYFPDGHPQAGIFKGMRNLIHERIAKGAVLPNPDKLKAECKGFKCPPGRTDCCCHQILFTQPDFVNQKSMLEEHCEARGYEVIFFPKFHCELNCIEQSWGFAKRIYRMFPSSSKEEDLERNMNAALDSVPLKSMRKFARRSDRFMDAYRKGLDGVQAVWASKRYRGHRVLPKNIMELFDKFFKKK
ncbi:hypothetical protein MVEN_01466400 [Mycena venus]|uniref:Uncharacterized protein n=1 Tax=Mycena venus TaxID=2733690 RepID=A0A8H6XVH7_9AGAR|nr:hypothetical protein MVEN_01466400 [Mycena venus]